MYEVTTKIAGIKGVFKLIVKTEATAKAQVAQEQKTVGVSSSYVKLY